MNANELSCNERASIHVGTSGFSFQDWVGPVYPPGIKKSSMLPFYEQKLGFDCLEINYTYYTMPYSRTMNSILARTSDDFRLSVKFHKDMTHNLRSTPSSPILDRTDVFSAFLEGIEPLVSSGRLACLLAQFPTSFYPHRDNWEYMLRCRDLMRGLPLVVEFRNGGWISEKTFESMKRERIGYCVVDEPRLPRLVPFVPEVTSDIAYIRLHGRNPRWFNVPSSERYNYLYSRDEMEEIAPHIGRLASLALRGAYVFFNNCHAGAAARNARLMKELLGLEELKGGSFQRKGPLDSADWEGDTDTSVDQGDLPLEM